MLRSAELTGNLDTVLDQLADYIERDLDARSKIISALVYPAIVVAMAIVTAVVLTMFVLPKFETFFDSLDAELPLPTRHAPRRRPTSCGSWGLFVGVGVAGRPSSASRSPYRTDEGPSRARRGRSCACPGSATCVRHAILERFCRILGLDGRRRRAAARRPGRDGRRHQQRRLPAQALVTAREAMLRGEGLAGPLSATELFPGAARQMFRVGEDTGTLDAQLATAANYFDRELDYKIKRFTACSSRPSSSSWASIVGFVAIAMVSAMYGIFNQSTSV